MSDAINKDVLIERVRKLLARTAERGATEAEAATALKMAKRLMEDHEISELDVQVAAAEGGHASVQFSAKDVSNQVHVFTTNEWTRWAQQLMLPIGDFTNTRAFYTDKRRYGGGVEAHFVGCKSDPMIAVELLKWLAPYMHSASLLWGKEARKNGGMGDEMARRSFKDGFVRGVHEQVATLKAQGEARKLDVHASGCTALVVITGREIVEAKVKATGAFMGQQGIKLGKGSMRRRRNFDPFAHSAGLTRGRSVDLGIRDRLNGS